MKKIVLSAISLLMVLLSVSAINSNDERVWYFSDGGAQYNIVKVDLEKTWYVPKYGSAYKDPGTQGDRENGTYGRMINVIGNIGCAFTDHSLKFTISTTGRFVSQSDPTKYREFFVALKPRYRRNGNNNDLNFNYEPNLEDEYPSTDPVPNTRNGDAVLYSPAQPRNGGGSHSSVTLGGVTYQFQRYYMDICICMDELTTEDLTHLAPGDDYIATIVVNWECTDPNCDKNESGNEWHDGSFVFVINGYYEQGSGSSHEVFLQLNPDPSSQNLDLVSMAKQNPVQNVKVADMEIYTMTKEKVSGKNWLQRISVFVSASPDYTKGTAGFRLRNTSSNDGYYIPYSVIVKDFDLITQREIQNSPNSSKEFDGSKAFGSLTSADMIELTQQTMSNKNGKEVYSIAYGATVYIRLGTDNQGVVRAYSSTDAAGQIVKDADNLDPAIAYNVSSKLAGIYTSDIYYFIIYN